MERIIEVGSLSLGGALGVNARYWLGLWVGRWAGHQFPWATLLINASGSFAIGLLATLLARWLPHPNLRLLAVTGFLGGFTTYSTFAFESLMLWGRGDRALGAGYVAGTVAAGLIAVSLGSALAHGLTGPGAERAGPGDSPPMAEADPAWPRDADGPGAAP